MNCAEVVDAAISLRPSERFFVIEALMESLDKPDSRIDAIWAEEAVHRLRAYREGRLPGVLNGVDES